jgi:hypothetical protein
LVTPRRHNEKGSYATEKVQQVIKNRIIFIFSLMVGGYLRRPPPLDDGFETACEGAEGAELFAAARAGACVCFTEVVFGEDA